MFKTGCLDSDSLFAYFLSLIFRGRRFWELSIFLAITIHETTRCPHSLEPLTCLVWFCYWSGIFSANCWAIAPCLSLCFLPGLRSPHAHGLVHSPRQSWHCFSAERSSFLVQRKMTTIEEMKYWIILLIDKIWRTTWYGENPIEKPWFHHQP